MLDLSAEDLPRVIVVLGDGEGEPQISPLVFGHGPEEGFMARMAREPAPICRRLCTADVERRSGRGADRVANQDEGRDGLRAA